MSSVTLLLATLQPAKRKKFTYHAKNDVKKYLIWKTESPESETLKSCFQLVK